MPTAIWQGIQNAPVMYPMGIASGLGGGNPPTPDTYSLDPVFWQADSVAGVSPQAQKDPGYNVLGGALPTAKAVLCAPFSVSRLTVNDPGFTGDVIAGHGSVMFDNTIYAATDPDSEGHIFLTVYRVGSQFINETIALTGLSFPFKLPYSGGSLTGFTVPDNPQVISAFGAPAFSMALKSPATGHVNLAWWNPTVLPGANAPVDIGLITLMGASTWFRNIPDFANDVNYAISNFTFNQWWVWKWRAENILGNLSMNLLNVPTLVTFGGPYPTGTVHFPLNPQASWHGWIINSAAGITPPDGSTFGPGLFLAAPDFSRYQWLQPVNGAPSNSGFDFLSNWTFDRSGGLYSIDQHADMWASYPPFGTYLPALPVGPPYQAQAIALPCFDRTDPRSLAHRRLLV